MFGSLTKSKKKKKVEDEDTANPSWLARDSAAEAGESDEGDEEEAAGESTPLISEDHSLDDAEDDYGGIEVDSEDNVTETRKEKKSRADDDRSKLSWSESSTSSSRRKASLKKKEKRGSTRTMMRKYQHKIEERRRRMLSGLPRRTCCHLIFVFINIVAVAACVCMILSQVVPLFFVQQKLLQIVLRGYITFFCVVFIVAEMELPLPFIRSSQSLHNFISKGFQFTFIAIVGMEQAQANLVEETMKKRHEDPMGIEWGWFTALFVEVPSWIMLGIGILYMLMGLLCMRPVRDRCREDYARRMEEYFEERQAEKEKKKKAKAKADMEDIEEE